MYKKLIIIIVAFAALTISSCKKFLEITPQQQFTSTIATSSLDGLTKTTTGAFGQMHGGNLYGGGIIANSELLADFVTANSISDYSLNQLRTRQMDANNSRSGGMWGDAYRAIYIANVVLQALPNFQSQNPAEVQLLKGECLFVRAAMHFELLRMFAQPSGYTSDDSHLGVPIVLLPGDITHGQSTPRSTVAQCYTQIEADLDTAINLLPGGLPGGGTFATRVVAQAFLTRVYFTQNKFQNALTYANAVVSSGGLSVVTSDSILYLSSLASSNTETIFEAISTPPTDLANSVRGFTYGIPFHPPTLYMSGAFYRYYQSDSASGSSRIGFYKKTGSGAAFEMWCKKYDDANLNLSVIRYSEILLDRAECNAQLGASDATVRADYNLIRTNRGLLADNTTAGSTALINAIRSERDMELSFEGDRFFEIKRRKLSFTSPESGEVFPWNSPQLVYPIPLQEVRQNTNMVQNPGY